MFLYLSQKIPIPLIIFIPSEENKLSICKDMHLRDCLRMLIRLFCSTHLFPNINLIKGISSEIIVDHGSLHPNFGDESNEKGK